MAKKTATTTKEVKITKSDITIAILTQSDEVKIGLLAITATSENLNKFTKDSLVEIVKVANPDFVVLKKSTKGEIIPAIIAADSSVFPQLINVIFTESNMMKMTKDSLEIIANESITVPTSEVEVDVEEVDVDVEEVDVDVEAAEAAEAEMQFEAENEVLYTDEDVTDVEAEADAESARAEA